MRGDGLGMRGDGLGMRGDGLGMRGDGLGMRGDGLGMKLGMHCPLYSTTHCVPHISRVQDTHCIGAGLR